MNTENIQNNNPFDNTIIAALSKTSFPLHISWYLSLSVGLLLLGQYFAPTAASNIILLFVSGLLSWTLIEYIMHRWLFHMVGNHPFIQKFKYLFHGIHHDNPKDEQRTMMPPIPGLLFSLVYFGVAYLFLDGLAFYFNAGIVLGYLIYSSLHYAIHLYKAPKLLQGLWTHHLIHHYQQENKAFGVSTRLWDRIFGTMPEMKGN